MLEPSHLHRTVQSPVRILFFTTSLGGGGAEKQMLRLVNELAVVGFEPVVAVCRRGGEYERLLHPDVALHSLAPKWITSSTGSLAASGLPLRRLVDRLQPEIVCSFMDNANVVAALSVRRGPSGPKLVLCVQNTMSEEWARGSHPVRRLVYGLARRTYPSADRIVALSQGVADDLVHHIPDAKPLITVIYNAGVDDELMSAVAEPLEPEFQPERPLVVACGRLAEQKGYPYLLKAFVEVHGATDAHLWILGDGPDRSALEGMADELGLSGAVRFLGFQKNPFKFMAAADLFVLSSIYEGFGNVVVEAMATGTPVVSADCPHGPGEIIEEGVSGLLVPPRDSAALAVAIRRVLQDPALARRLGEAGRRRAQDFHISRSASSYGAEFLRLAGRPDGHAR